MKNEISYLSYGAEKQFAEAIDAMGHASGAVSKTCEPFSYHNLTYH